MSDWKTYKLGEISDDIAMGPFGSNLKVDNFIAEGVPVIRGMNLHEGGFNKKNFAFVSEEKAKSLKRCLAYPDDLVFTHRGTLGQVGIIPRIGFEKYLVSQSQMRLSVNKKILNPKFLYYFFKSPLGQKELLRNSSQVGVPAIANPTKSLKEVEISVPDLELQAEVVNILSSLDDKIELNLQMNQTLEAMAQAIFKEWFVNFSFPGFDGTLVDGLPKGWKIEKIGNIFNVTDYVANGSFASLKENVTLLDYEDYAIYVRTTDNNSNFSKDLKYVDEKSFNFLKKSRLYGNEIIISNVGDVGTVFRPPVWLNKPMTLGSNAIMITDSVLNNYICQFLLSSEGQHAISGLISGSAQPKFNKTAFRNLEVTIPSDRIIEKFNSIYDSLRNKINANKENINCLTQIRDSLLPKLMTGKIEIQA